MGLRLHTILVLGGAIVLAVAALSYLLAGLNQRNFGDLERREIIRDLTRAVNAIRAELNALEVTTLDWAVWDAAYEYLLRPNSEFQLETFNPTNLSTLDLEYLIMQDSQGRLVDGLQRTPVGNYLRMQPEAMRLTEIKNWIWFRESNFIVRGGLVEFDRGLYLVASSPVIPSSRVRQPSGVITMVRRLDSALVGRLNEQTQLSFALLTQSVDGSDPQLNRLFEVATVGSAASQDEIRFDTSGKARGFRVMNIPGREPPLVLRVDFPREIYLLGQQSNGRLLLTIAGFGLLLLGVVLGLLERSVLSRLQTLSGELSRIGASSEGGLRVSVNGQDELAVVARNINAGLEQIENTQVRAAKAEADLERFQRLAAEEMVFRQSAELDALQFEMYERLALIAEFRDDETAQHTLRVGELSSAVAQRLGMTETECRNLRFAARLHDIGKIAIPDAVLLKPGKLTPAEWELMQSHALIGARMLEGSHSAVLEMAYEIALTHHERWDGLGYPNRLKNQQIPLVGRIVAVADCLDALLSSRPYKEAWPLERALEEIKSCEGTRYDPVVVQAFLEVIQEQSNLIANQTSG